MISGWIDQKPWEECGQDLLQQKPEPADQAAEVVARGGEDGVVGVAMLEPEIVASHAVLGFEMADHGLDGGPAAQFTLDLGRHPSLLAGDEDPELVVGRRVVAAVPLVGEDEGLINYRTFERLTVGGRVAILEGRDEQPHQVCHI